MRPAATPVDCAEITEDELWTRLHAAGGVLRIVDPDEPVRAAWRRAFAAAVRADPNGDRRLSFSGWRQGDIVVALAPSQREYRPLPLHGRTVLRLIGDGKPEEPQPAPGPTRRALRLINALTAAAKRRGHQIGTASYAGRRPCDLCLIVGGREYPLAITAHGRMLTVALPSHYPGRRTWTDGKLAKVEHKVDDLLDSLEARAAAAEWRRAEWDRVEAERAAAMQPLLDRARQDYLRDRQRQALQELAAQWRTACDIKALCDTARQIAAQDELPSAVQAFAQWIETHATLIDPLYAVPAMPEFDEPSMEDLAPYLATYEEMRQL